MVVVVCMSSVYVSLDQLVCGCVAFVTNMMRLMERRSKATPSHDRALSPTNEEQTDREREREREREM